MLGLFTRAKVSEKAGASASDSTATPAAVKTTGSAAIVTELKSQLKVVYDHSKGAAKSINVTEQLDCLLSASKAILSLNIFLMKYLIATQSSASGTGVASLASLSTSVDASDDVKSLAKEVDAIFSDSGLSDVTQRSVFLPANQNPLQGVMQLIKANILPSSWIIFYPKYVQKILNAMNEACDSTGKFLHTLPVEQQYIVLNEIINFANEAITHPSASRHPVTQEFYNLFASTKDRRVLEQFLSNKEYVESFIYAARLLMSKDSAKIRSYYNQACRQGYSFAMALLNNTVDGTILIDASFKHTELRAMIRSIPEAMNAMFEDGATSIKSELKRLASADIHSKTLKSDLGYILLQIYQVNKLIDRARLALIVGNIPLEKSKQEAIQAKLPLAFKYIARFAPAAGAASGAGVTEEASPVLTSTPVVTLFDRFYALQSTEALSEQLLCESFSLGISIPSASAVELPTNVASVMLPTKPPAESAAESTAPKPS